MPFFHTGSVMIISNKNVPYTEGCSVTFSVPFPSEKIKKRNTGNKKDHMKSVSCTNCFSDSSEMCVK